MRSYTEICSAIGYNRREKPPELKYHWIAYDQGNVIPCKSQFEASKYTLNERVIEPESKNIHDAYFENIIKNTDIATQIFFSELRNEYKTLSDPLYKLCLAESSDKLPDAHNLEGLALIMIDVVHFANMVRSVE